MVKPGSIFLSQTPGFFYNWIIPVLLLPLLLKIRRQSPHTIRRISSNRLVKRFPETFSAVPSSWAKTETLNSSKLQ